MPKVRKNNEVILNQYISVIVTPIMPTIIIIIPPTTNILDLNRSPKIEQPKKPHN